MSKNSQFSIIISQLVSSVGQHLLNPLLVALGNYRIDIEITFSLASFLSQDMTCVRMSALEFARPRRAKTLCRTFMCF
jgi:hypothetical protein